MSKITLDIDNKDVDTVLLILKNLKSGLIKNIQVDNKNISSTNQLKKVPKQKILEDEFIPKTSSSKYMSRNTYKEKLHNNKGN